MKKFLLFLLALLILQTISFAESSSYVKQIDEFSCGPVSSYNLIKKSCPACRDYDINKLKSYERTDNNGTTTYNLCNGLNKYFKSQNLQTNISYYGVKKLKRYKNGSNVDFQNISKLLNEGNSAILNIGVYTLNDDGSYTRHWGHYVNLISVSDNKLKVFDPYDKANQYSDWTIKTLTDIKVNNINDNEKYVNLKNYHIISSQINYLEKNEFALVNGVILINDFE